VFSNAVGDRDMEVVVRIGTKIDSVRIDPNTP
jgi:hypothetical protein